MNPRLRVALLGAASMLLASAAHAQPSAMTSILGANFPPGPARGYIQVEGQTAGLPDGCGDGRCGNYVIVVNDAMGAPVIGATVSIDFGACSPAAGGDISINANQLTPVTGQTFAAPATVSAVTMGGGVATFQVMGRANSSTLSLPSPAQSPGFSIAAAPPCALVTATLPPFAPVVLGSLHVVAYDINGLGSPAAAVNSPDVATVAVENVRGVLSGVQYRRTDIDLNGVINSADVARMMQYAIDGSLGTGTKSTLFP